MQYTNVYIMFNFEQCVLSLYFPYYILDTCLGKKTYTCNNVQLSIKTCHNE
jgi:hypothetical protein